MEIKRRLHIEIKSGKNGHPGKSLAKKAMQLGLTGYVKHKDEGMELVAEGKKEHVWTLIKECTKAGQKTKEIIFYIREFKGNTMKGTWETSVGQGTYTWTQSAAGDTFTGDYNGVYKWCGARPGKNFPDNCSFSGVWNVQVRDSVGCTMTLAQKDNTVSGTYCNGTVEGSISHGSGQTVATGTWRSGSSAGQFTFYLPGYDSKQFSGNYDGAYQWCGWRSDSTIPNPCMK